MTDSELSAARLRELAEPRTPQIGDEWDMSRYLLRHALEMANAMDDRDRLRARITFFESALKRARRDNKTMQADFHPAKCREDDCAEERATTNGACGACAICCDEEHNDNSRLRTQWQALLDTLEPRGRLHIITDHGDALEWLRAVCRKALK